ncbi:MAG: hypothetical protein WAP03_18815 [Methylorubrum rhodinum]|uniref:hypothetical protein n=1 Tax=Methylorubrum rhodinum TaxID=29428 RepID=UPI003BB057F9
MSALVSLSACRPDQSGLRHRIERALEEALDTAARLIAFLDDLDGDPDTEDDGTAEPALAALVTGDAQIRWAGFEGDAA